MYQPSCNFLGSSIAGTARARRPGTGLFSTLIINALYGTCHPERAHDDMWLTVGGWPTQARFCLSALGWGSFLDPYLRPPAQALTRAGCTVGLDLDHPRTSR